MVKVGMEIDIVKSGRGHGASEVSVLLGGDGEFAALPRQGETVIIPKLGLCSKVAKVIHFTSDGRPYLVLQPHYTDNPGETVENLKEIGWVVV